MIRDVLGINRRDLELVYAGNARRHFPDVDDKLRTKKILREANLPVPALLAEVSERPQIQACLDRLRSHTRFVVKPSRGSGGQGVRVVLRDPNHDDGDLWGDLAYHMASILAGRFARDSLEDRVLVEAYVEEHSELTRIHGARGVSDVRILCHQSRALMAMLRVPCAASDGKSNLHSGGVGIGVDLTTGITTDAIQNGRGVEAHPDTGLPLRGISIPCWRELLELCAPMNSLFQLDYLGLDVSIDATQGPLILELNARPGLNIQIANRSGLRERLRGLV